MKYGIEKKETIHFHCESAEGGERGAGGRGWFMCQKGGIFRVEVSSQGLIHGKHLRDGIHKKLRKKHVKHKALFPQTNFENTMPYFFYILVTTEILVV